MRAKNLLQKRFVEIFVKIFFGSQIYIKAYIHSPPELLTYGPLVEATFKLKFFGGFLLKHLYKPLFLCRYETNTTPENNKNTYLSKTSHLGAVIPLLASIGTEVIAYVYHDASMA